MDTIVTIVLPVFAIILTGYAAGWSGLLNEAGTAVFNRFVFYIALPVLLFYSMARVEPSVIFNWPFIITYLGGQIVTGIVGWLLFISFFKGRLAAKSLFSLTVLNGNTGHMGIPLLLVAYGESAALAAIIATIINIIIIIGFCVALVELDLKARDHPMRAISGALLATLKNPLFISSVAGIAWSFTGWALPAPVDTFCKVMGAAAPPMGLFVIGLFLFGKPLHANAGEVGAMVFLKLFVHPVITWIIAGPILGMEPFWVGLAVLLTALPMGANGFVLAHKYGIYADRSSAAILISTVLSVITLSIVFSIDSLGLAL